MYTLITILTKKSKTLLVLLFVFLLSGFSELYSQEIIEGKEYDYHQMHWGRFWARAVMDRNLIWCPIWNIGNVTDSRVEPRKPMRWPGSASEISYVNYGNFFIGAKVPNMKGFEGKVITDDMYNTIEDQITLVSNAYLPHISVHTPAQVSSDRTHQQIWAPVPGFFNGGQFGFIWGINEDVNQDGELAPSEDVNFNGELDHNLDPPESIINSMAISTDKRTWPEYWPGGSFVKDERPYYGRPPKTDGPGERVGRWNGEYKIAPIADQETLYRMDDHENDMWNDYYGATSKYYPMKNADGTPDSSKWKDEVGIAGIGFEVEARTYGWFHPLAEDLLVSIYRVRNYSDYKLNRVVTGMFTDATIGRSEYNYADFIPATFDYEGEGGRLDFDILYQWQLYPDEINTYQNIGTFAFAFLESPGIPDNFEDDDADGMTDESMNNLRDDDGDWRPFADIGLDRLGPGDEGYRGPDADGTEGNGTWDTEDLNLNGGMDAGEDKNKNDKLDFEPINDDRGKDGKPSEFH